MQIFFPSLSLLNQTHAGHGLWSAHAWFLKTAFVHVLVCVCVCVPIPKGINNQWRNIDCM